MTESALNRDLNYIATVKSGDQYHFGVWIRQIAKQALDRIESLENNMIDPFLRAQRESQGGGYQTGEMQIPPDSAWQLEPDVPAIPIYIEDSKAPRYERMELAICALNGMLAHPRRYKPRPGANPDWHIAIAEEAFEIADAMIKIGGK
jgi:hypothetical protein